ncbi:hypothetical protein [Herbiconiux solani]|uniref:hypothetical protein n=1 Tax=Herbiconiux solani TaxID=661329 RepID=UPI000826D693|nr:hypothetical protein [Herbiconiux solani]
MTTEYKRVLDRYTRNEYDIPLIVFEQNPDDYTALEEGTSFYQRPPVIAAETIEPPKSGAGSGESEWRTYAEQLGLDTSAAESRADLIALVEEHHAPKNSSVTDGAGTPEPVQATESHEGPVAPPVEEKKA